MLTSEALPSTQPEQRNLRRDPPGDTHELHLLVEELEDDHERSRRRESLWISMVLHLLVFITFLLAPKLFPRHDNIVLLNSTDQLKDHDVQFLDLPPDAQKKVPPPKTDIISDKDRIAQARQPTIDRHTLEELREARKQGPPGPKALAAPAPVQSAPAAPPQSGQQQAPSKPPENSNQIAKLESPPLAQAPPRNVFSSAGSPGSAIEQAARAAAASRGGGGEYGIGPLTPNSPIHGDIDVLSDTLGVDFGPYLARVLHDVRTNWYNLIPEEAMSPLYKQGKLTIQFVITKNGSVEGMRMIAGSGDVSLDRAAWGGITSSDPFPPLPAQFRGPYLALRFRFYYNPDRAELR